MTRTASLSCAAILALAIIAPRLSALDQFFIQDEHLWINRAQLYSQAMQKFDLTAAAAFELQNHPAITLLSAVGPTMQIYSARHDLEGTYESWSPEHRLAAAAWARWVMGLVTSLTLLALWTITSRLNVFQKNPVITGIVPALIGLEPWIWGITRTVIVDTLMAIFVAASLITAAKAREKQRWYWIAGSAAWWGLAFISKSPALIVLPFCLLLPTLFWKLWKKTLKNIALWLVSAYVTMSIAWPPFFIHPIARIKGVLARVEFHTGAPEVYLWPGIHPPFFIFVLSATALIGCLIYIALRFFYPQEKWRDLLAFDALLVAGLFFGAVLLYLQGDHARKNVPVLALLAGAGAGGWLLLIWKLKIQPHLGVAAVVILHLISIAPWFPHLPSFHSPFFNSEGGKRMLVDVGNGSRKIADYINYAPEPIVAAVNVPGLISPYLLPEHRSRLRRMPQNGDLQKLSPDTTHLFFPLSYPARITFDPDAKNMTAALQGRTPNAIIRIRDVPLFAVYKIK